ncbi:hypothetical protein OAQ08_02190 [Alphaproteobacteria bacterium]|nr:hypothetical protein [Alphaproteobacteria bacterium]
MKNFIIPVETKSRDYESRLLILIYLIKISKNENINCFFGERRKILSLNHNFSNFIYLSLGVDQQLLFYKNLIKNNGVCVSLDEEGAIFTNNTKKIKPRHKNNKYVRPYIAKIFVWGNNAAKDTLEKNNQDINQSNIIVTGNPRFDLSKPFFKNYYDSKSQKKNQYILINCAFGTINNYVNPKMEGKYWALKLSNFPSYKKYIKPTEDYEKKLFPLFIEGIKSLIHKFPNEKFVIRPHPIEEEETYIKFFKDYNNVIIDKSQSVQCDFIKAKLLIHNGCTTAIEASFNKLNSICYLPYYDKNFIQELTSDVSKLIHKKDDLLNSVYDILNKKIINQNIEKKFKIIKPLIDNVDYFSFEKISKKLFEINQTKELTTLKHLFKKNFIQNMIHIFFYKLRIKIANIYINFFMKKNTTYFSQVKKREFNKLDLSYDEVKHDVDKLSNLLNLDIQIVIKQTDKNCFIISKK